MNPNGPTSPAAGTELELRWRSSRHTRRLLTLGLTGLFIAVLAHRPEFAGLAAPALVLLAAGRARQQLPRIIVRAKPTTRRAFEDERLAVDVTADGTDDYSVRWRLHPGPEIAPVGATAADGRQARFVVTPERWGRRQIGKLEVTLRDRWRLAEGHATMTLPALDCYPTPARQQTTVVLRRLPNRLGEHPARTSGEGIEFFGVREYVPGDRQRSINWAASTRRGRLQVNTFAAERSQDVVLLVDSTSDVGQPGSSALDLALRGAGAAARAYLEARDRVGVITYQWGGASWLAPGLGRRQVYRIIDSMLASPVLADTGGYARGASFARLPRAALPPGALVVVFSPLLDQRFVEALRDMRERGFSMLVVDVLNTEPPARRRTEDRLARRLWRMEQDAIRFSLRELGIPVVHWDGEEPLDLPLASHTRRPMAARR
ncbi:MAG TPA: DUF58 domain-containing protein [Streptosporangiaceae bacterium]|nr:DUF58 domain-containing protein [Streptosporangiaceae bacterium]